VESISRRQSDCASALSAVTTRQVVSVYV
jgi:hypothetical protein